MTKLYLHREGVGSLPSGTLPSSEQSSLTADTNLFDNEDGSENRVMDDTISAQAQTSLTNTSTADTNAHNYYIARWVSPKLNMTSISANTWNLKFAASEGNANANFPRNGAGALRIVAYCWKPSNGTKYGDILDGNSAADFEEAGTTQTLIEGTFSGAAVSSLTADDVVIVFELWAIVTQSMGTAYSQTVFYDGTTESSTSNNAAFLETPQTLTFSSSLITRSISESISISPAVARVATKFRTTSDSISISPAVIRLYTAIRSISQSISISDALAEAALKFRTMADSVTISDALEAHKLLPRQIAETIGISDAVSRFKLAVRSISEPISISDSLARVASFFRSINQSISISDVITGFKLFTRSISQSIGISDSVTRLKTAIRAISQSTSISDAVTEAALKLRSISQSITISDSISKTLTKIISISQPITISDSITKLRTVIRNVSDSISISDAVTKLRTVLRNITQSVTIADVLERLKIPSGAGQLFEVFINETISLSDTLSTLIKKFIKIGGRPPAGNIFRRKFEERRKKWTVDWRKKLNKRLGIE